MKDKIDYRATFLAQFEGMKTLPLFERMSRTVEDSPWHREANVLVHTGMVVDEYVKLVDHETFDAHTDSVLPWTKNDYLGAIAAAFHDTGKPPAEIKKWSEARGDYRAYHGHELLSARLFETYAADRFPMFSAEDIATVSFIIEHHMPWSVEDKDKRRHLALTANHYGGAEVFARHLLADQYGRFADDQPAKNKRADEWVAEFMELAMEVKTPRWNEVVLPDDAPVMYIPVAPSGAGKSTYLAKLRETTPDINVFSLDALRHEWYDADDYVKAYQGSVDDKGFEARANARFHAQVKERRTMYIDNTNLSARRRKMYLEGARKNGYKTVAVLLPISLEVLLKRRTARPDKTVPEAAVRQHYNALQAPLLGEFHEIIVSDHNLQAPK
jgi:predicted kinase